MYKAGVARCGTSAHDEAVLHAGQLPLWKYASAWAANVHRLAAALAAAAVAHLSPRSALLAIHTAWR
jgi:hypothetical protein